MVRIFEIDWIILSKSSGQKFVVFTEDTQCISLSQIGVFGFGVVITLFSTLQVIPVCNNCLQLLPFYHFSWILMRYTEISVVKKWKKWVWLPLLLTTITTTTTCTTTTEERADTLPICQSFICMVQVPMVYYGKTVCPPLLQRDIFEGVVNIPMPKWSPEILWTGTTILLYYGFYLYRTYHGLVHFSSVFMKGLR